MGQGLGQGFALMVGSLLLFVLLGSFAPTVISSFATAGTATGAGSFSNAISFNNLFPMFFYIVGMIVTFGGVIGGGYSTYKSLRR